MRAALRLIVLGFLALSAAGCAGAPSTMDAFDPNQTRVITPTEATSTCIGDISTPLCATETFIACSRRLDKSLCEKAGVFKFSMPDKPGTTRYRVQNIRTIRDQDISPDLRHTAWMRPGHVKVEIIYVDWHGPLCSQDGCHGGYILKQTPPGWQIVTWSVGFYE